MKSNRWIDSSRRLYSRLLKLYPQEHQTEYGPSILQVFTDQCRESFTERGVWGLLILWLRTLFDLGISSLREHLVLPNAASGLLQAIPNRPLPWKGVLMVLIPGLVFLISQIGQLSGQNWFFWATRRSVFYLIIPVLLVGLVTKKFPIWGLIPLGLLYNTFLSFGFRLQKGSADRSDWLEQIRYITTHSENIRIAVVLAMLAVIILLFWLNARNQHISHITWIWLGIYVIVGIPEITRRLVFYNSESILTFDQIETVLGTLGFDYYDFYFQAGFLVLILLGGLLAHRVGQLSILLPLGYLVPIVVYGNPFNLPSDKFSYIMTISAVLTYRFLITVVAPIWIVRSASESAQKRASMIGLWGLVGIQAVMVIFKLTMALTLPFPNLFGYFYPVLTDQLYLPVAIALAINLYQRTAPKESEPQLIPYQTQLAKR